MDGEDFNSSDSDTDDQILIKDTRHKNTNSDAVLNFEDDDDDDDVEDGSDGSDVDMGSDIEDRKDDLPDDRAWGQRRKNFYNTDYVDQDYGGYNADEAEAAVQEEEEARRIQLLLLRGLNDADFSLGDLSADPVAEDSARVEKLLEPMSRRQQLQFFQRESPEFDNLVNDFLQSIKEVLKIMKVLSLIEDGTLVDWPAEQYVKTKYRILLSYCSSALFYIILKSKRIPLQDHPVLNALARTKMLLQSILKLDDEFGSEVERVLLNVVRPPEERRTLKALKKQPKKVKVAEDSAEVPAESQPEEEEEEESALGKRAITYEMAKNKGLTPKRKKEQRNPRVKHRNKFKKALVRRRGQVRTARKEIPVYGGEPSGIKIGLKKGRKFQ